MNHPGLRIIVFLLVGAVFTACSGGSSSSSDSGQSLPPVSDITYTAGDTYLNDNRSGNETRVFMAGVNLGVGVPGTQAGELAAEYDDYARWFDTMSDAGINVLRIYTLHFPRFYEALYDHNRARELAGLTPLYLMHGIWLDEEGDIMDNATISAGYNDHGFFGITDFFDGHIQEAVDAVHGNLYVPHRFGRAYGTFDHDVSRWVIGWIIGREVAPNEVQFTNDSNATVDGYDGTYLDVLSAPPMESWIAARLDNLSVYEWNTYSRLRPVSFSSWPTLDPLAHPTEPDISSEDYQQIDLTLLDDADHPAGLFITYHAYPYYPDFISETPAYRDVIDDRTREPNSYLGYLQELRNHYAAKNLPLVIAEFGASSSFGAAHYAHNGIHHGGLTETEQGEAAGRMLTNIFDAGAAGGMYFAWIDEWWKPSWITNDLDFTDNDTDKDNRKIWANLTAPEQNFGFIAFDNATPPVSPLESIPGSGVTVSASADAAYFWLEVDNLTPIDTGQRITIGLDTYDDNLGESILTDNATLTNLRAEFSLDIHYDNGTWQADLYVTEAYDLYGVWESAPNMKPGAVGRSTATDGAPWHIVTWLNNNFTYDDHADTFYGDNATTTDNVTIFGPGNNREQEIGRLTARSSDGIPSSHDAVIIDDTLVRVSLPWTLINVTDPSARRVFHDNASTTIWESVETGGIAVAVSVDGTLKVETERHLWSGWSDTPLTTERIKPGLQIFGAAVNDLMMGF